MSDSLYAKIIIDISHESVDRPFTYIVPENLSKIIEVGTVVSVPFGKGNNPKKGIVIELTDKTDVPLDKLKYVLDISERDISLSDQRIRHHKFLTEPERTLPGTAILIAKV